MNSTRSNHAVRFSLRLLHLSAILSFLALHQSHPAELLAQWNGGSGDWTHPANWTVTENGLPHAAVMPNNTASDTFDVTIDAASSALTIPAGTSIEIRKLTLNTRAAPTQAGINGNGSLTVTGDCQWLNGYLSPVSLKLLGNVTVSTAGPNDTLGLGDVILAGHTFVGSGATLRLGSNSVRNEAGGTIEFDDAATLVSSADFQNLGTFRVLPGSTRFAAGPFFTLVNAGTVELPAKTVSIVGGLKQTGGTTHLDGTHFEATQGQLSIQGGALAGHGEIVVNSVTVSSGATVKGSFDCSQVLGVQFAIGSTLELELRDVNDYDSFKTAFLELHGSLKVDIASPLAQGAQPLLGFKIVEAGQINGQFDNVAAGQRVQISNDPGSYLLSRVDGPPVQFFLSTYTTDPIQLQFSQVPLLYGLPPHFDFALDTNATLTAVSSLNWDGATLEAQIVQGFDPTEDQLIVGAPGYRVNGNSILVDNGVGTGATIAAYTNFADHVTIFFNANAAAQDVQDLLRAFYYENSQFRGEWFEHWDDKEADRKIDILLTAHAGTNLIQRKATATIDFPFLAGITSDAPTFSVCQGASITMNIIGLFSDQSTAAVPFLETSFTSSNPGLVVTQVPKAHGTASLVFNSIGSNTVTATAGNFSASTSIPVQDCWMATPGGNFLGCVSEFIWDLFRPIDAAVDPMLLGNRDNFPLAAHNVGKLSATSATPTTNSAFSLELLRSVRALLNQTAQGQQLVQLYEKHTLDVVRIMSTHRQLLTNIYQIFVDFSPGLNALLQGQGSAVQITPAMISELSIAWTQLENLGSVELRKDMEDQRTRFQGFLAFAGKNFKEWASLLEVPAPSVPFLYVSKTGVNGGAFFLNANDLPGLEFSLWKSPAITPPAWVRVDGARITRDGFSATLVDTNPPSTRVFYQVRALPVGTP